MIGTIIGDIAGSIYKLNNTSDYNFNMFSDKNTFTADTVCTIAIADALMNHKPIANTLKEWCKKYPDRGYEHDFEQWVNADSLSAYESNSNGSAMRVSACGWMANNGTEAKNLATMTAEVTHNHPEGINGAQAIAKAICQLRCGIHKRDVFINIIRQYYPNFTPQWFNAYRSEFREDCQTTIPIAMYLMKNSISFEDAIRSAVVYGGDSNTLAAITGSMAEAIYGVPDKLKQECLKKLPEDMVSIIKTFEQKYQDGRTCTTNQRIIRCFLSEYNNNTYFLMWLKSKFFGLHFY